jgi:hypothetical protein
MPSTSRRSAKQPQPPKIATCPHCWNSFQPHEAFFIAAHPELVGDPVLGEHVPKRLALTEVQITGKSIKDPKGFPIEDRACPSCRLQVPTAMLAKQPLFMSMAGAPSSGKTYYITSLIHALRQQLPRDFNLLFEYAISHDIKTIDDQISRLYAGNPDVPVFLEKTEATGGATYNQITIQGQTVDLPKPFLFAVRPTPSNIDFEAKAKKLHQHLAFYDCAGEHFQYGYLRQTTRNTSRAFGHFAHANALLFTYDPLQDQPAIQRLSQQSADPQVREQRLISQQDKTFEAVVQQFRTLRKLSPTSSIKAPLLVCVQKYDVWAPLIPKWAQLDATSVVRFATEGTSALDVQELNRHSLHIRKFLHDISPMFVAQAESNFSLVRYFAVSALGASPTPVEIDNEDEYGNRTKGTKLCVRPRDLHPFRVTDPFLWLLAHWKLIRTAIPQAKPVDGMQKATIAADMDTSVRIVLPDSKESLVIDRDYLGTQIIDPFSGTPVWIPSKLAGKRRTGGGLKGWFGMGKKPQS